MAEREIPEDVAEFARSRLGPELVFRFAGWPHTDSRVWRAQTRSGAAFYVKQHAEPRLFSRHLFACREWVPRLPVRVPALVGVSDEALQTLIFSELPGQVMESLELPRDIELDMYREAGKATRALHSLPCHGAERPGSAENFDAAADFRDLLRACCAQAEGMVPSATLRWALDCVGDAASFRGLQRVPCHRDQSPRNWLIELHAGGARFGWIDFERAKPDLALYDLQRLWADHFRRDPARKRAFLEGYGGALSELEEYNLSLIVLRTHIATVAWAHAHGDPAFARYALETLDWLKTRL